MKKFVIVGSRSLENYGAFCARMLDIIRKEGQPDIIYVGNNIHGVDCHARQWVYESKLKYVPTDFSDIGNLMDKRTVLVAFPGISSRWIMDAVLLGKRQGSKEYVLKLSERRCKDLI